MASATTMPVAASASRTLGRDLLGLALIALVGLAGYWLFPDNLAFLTRVISVALLVLSLDLIVGYCGVASLGQGALYGAGAYAAGIACINGVTDPVLLILIGAVAGATMGLLMGAIMLRAHGLPQLVLSIAIVQLLHEAANKASSITGGSDGLSGMSPAPLFGLFEFDLWGRSAYLFGLGLLLIVFAVLRFVTRSPFGMVCRGLKEDPLRISALGIYAFPVLLKMFVISGTVAGMGGALAAIATQVVGLDSVSFEISANALVMLVLGGIGHLYGALIGTVIFMALEHIVAAINPFHWMTLVGAVLIAIVLFAPRGLSGTLDELARLLTRERWRTGR
ncbi:MULTISPECIES: branched-chain amino acid ABC transporter permease [Bosea]|uniref:branched-chain amino acid ABC transporter permease n=1 Tax=Bosea TaxID=85413 RepID=UPI002150477D|nr:MULTISPECIES: branched-chain amino acid ABC transporter permease [Bosea]MCR4524162.1 branched-chain amino acid ABC transporter permease [Bosea sp. 47.2.35]MDR6828001.1 branched-chain amino acid transport system permease protein [Bosea robiniae]MDR6894849.1 branched-chain amino acid transport system permease protein [Bosea sp. BE109]MDR7138107.1 branched-chain amino acid transport system permease protein [Bosea sp. BE168]MDR7174806.1 branched-chain amino acid transport system permease protei